ncbi:TPA: acyltransferase family protein [Enterobacter cloacae]|uniref:acyltransferase family protein n=1 Tax=Enterobacter cloacae complex TaxID=354276 RepID=UPI001EED6305|nr:MULTISPECIES: acyltransferase family protein [Enterobacter cloacae complex]MCR1298826.1 acyltransferase family protein [Enterobacter kobei]HBN1087995.1 acyltransferase family protein [Enterobacter cloacae]
MKTLDNSSLSKRIQPEKKIEIMNEERSLILDYAKSIGIILVVMYHLKTSFFNVYHAYMFHMPLFFFLGGMLYKNKGVKKSIYGTIKKQFFYLIYTYIILSLIASGLAYHYGLNTGKFIDKSITETITLPLRSNFHNNKIFLVAWFILAYGCISIIFSLIQQALSKFLSDLSLKITVVTLGVISAYISVNYLSIAWLTQKEPQYLLSSQITFGMFFYAMGFALSSVRLTIYNTYMFIILTATLYVLRNYGLATSTVMSWAQYKDGFIISIFTAMCGIYAVMFISKLLAKEDFGLNILREIGRSSRDIMSYHLLCFLFIDIILHYYYGFTLVGKDAYKDHYYDKWTWPVYVMIGVLAPTVVSYTYRAIKARRF